MLVFVVEQHTYLFSWSTSKSLFAPPSAQSLISTACHARSRRSLRMGWFTMMRAYFFVACPLRSSSQVHVLTGCAGMAADEVERLCIAIPSRVEKSCTGLLYVMQHGRHHIPMSSREEMHLYSDSLVSVASHPTIHHGTRPTYLRRPTRPHQRGKHSTATPTTALVTHAHSGSSCPRVCHRATDG